MDAEEQKAEEGRQLKMIRERMPQVYGAVKVKATEIGNDAYALVRRGIRGEPGCFFALELGVTVGTPWNVDVPTDVAQLVARYGMSFLCMWPVAEVADGAH